MELIRVALEKKYPNAEFEYHLNDDKEVVFDSWSDEDADAPTNGDVIIATDIYKLQVKEGIETFNTDRLMAVLNESLPQSTVFKLASHTANLMGYCSAKQFWGEKSTASYVGLLESTETVTPEELILIKLAFVDQHIDLDNPFEELD